MEGVLIYTYGLYLWGVIIAVCWSMNDFRLHRGLKVLSVIFVTGCVATGVLSRCVQSCDTDGGCGAACNPVTPTTVVALRAIL